MFALDIDPAQQVSMTFQKRGRGFIGMSFLINPAIEIPAMAFPNIVTFTESTETVNMLQTHIDSDKSYLIIRQKRANRAYSNSRWLDLTRNI